MPAAVVVLPPTLRVGNAIATYKLNKIDSPHPNLDHVFLHMEKVCALDAVWYPVDEIESILRDVQGDNVWCDQGFLRDARTCEFHVNYDKNPSAA